MRAVSSIFEATKKIITVPATTAVSISAERSPIRKAQVLAPWTAWKSKYKTEKRCGSASRIFIAGILKKFPHEKNHRLARSSHRRQSAGSRRALRKCPRWIPLALCLGEHSDLRSD